MWYEDHPWFDGERCVLCGTNYYDAMMYEIPCVPKAERKPYNYTSESPYYTEEKENDQNNEKTLR